MRSECIHMYIQITKYIHITNRKRSFSQKELAIRSWRCTMHKVLKLPSHETHAHIAQCTMCLKYHSTRPMCSFVHIVQCILYNAQGVLITIPRYLCARFALPIKQCIFYNAQCVQITFARHLSAHFAQDIAKCSEMR